jgi:hypothetical protein
MHIDDNTGGTFDLIANVQDILSDYIIENNTVSSFGSLGDILDQKDLKLSNKSVEKNLKLSNNLVEKNLKLSNNSVEKDLKLSGNEVFVGNRRSRRLSGIYIYMYIHICI